MEKQKLSRKQIEILKKMGEGVEYSSYILGASFSTMDALSKKGFVKCINSGALGSMFSPTTILKWVKIKKLNSEGKFFSSQP